MVAAKESDENKSYAFEMSPMDLVQFIGMEPIAGKKIIDQIIQNDSILYVENNQIISKDVYSIRNSSTISNRSKNRSITQPATQPPKAPKRVML